MSLINEIITMFNQQYGVMYSENTKEKGEWVKWKGFRDYLLSLQEKEFDTGPLIAQLERRDKEIELLKEKIRKLEGGN